MDIPKPSRARPYQLSLRLSDEERAQLEWLIERLANKWGKANAREVLRAALQLLYTELRQEEEQGPRKPRR